MKLPVLNSTYEEKVTTFIGKEGEYEIHSSSLIFQSQLNLEGEGVSNKIVHLTAESIRNIEDRNRVKYKITELELDEIAYSLIG